MMIAAKHEFQIRCIHIRGVDNRISDLLSRWDLDELKKRKFLELMQGRDMREVKIYQSHWELNEDL